LRLDTIKDLVEAGRPREASVELERLRGVADEIYDDIGESIAGLRTNVAERGLVRALEDYVDQFEELHQIPVTLRAEGPVDQIPAGEALQLFRLIQEALTNVRKHAAARMATVKLTFEGSGQLSVAVVDDGRGFMPSAGRNGYGRPLGLTGMRERVESLGGTLEVQSEPGSGTRVTATVPMPRTRRESKDAAVATPPR
jgi:signal transduction histidine kinase